MPSYALLVLAVGQPRYALASAALTVAELGVLATTRLGDRLGDAEPTRIAGVPYLTFDADLTADDLDVLGDVSTAMALFERDGDRPAAGRAPATRPLRRRPADDPQVPGQDQRAVHQAAAQRDGLVDRPSGRPMPDRPLHVLDPMCGRGTTLNQVLMNGWHAAGIDVDARDFDAYAAFLRTLAQAQAAQAHRRRRRRCDATAPSSAGASDAEIGATKEDWKAGDAITLDFVNADTLDARAVHRAAQLRRGRHRRAVRRPARQPVRRRPRAQPARPAARGRARSGSRCSGPAARSGSPGTPTCPPAEALRRSLADAGLEPLDDGPYRGFEHRVDQAIQRDVLVARKPGLACPHGDRKPATDTSGTTRQLRVSDEDRHKVAEILREAAGEGRIDLEELDERLEATYAAKTYADLVPDHRRPAGPRAAGRQHARPAPRVLPATTSHDVSLVGDGGVQAAGRLARAGPPHGLRADGQRPARPARGDLRRSVT